jgi:hypothetical protein
MESQLRRGFRFRFFSGRQVRDNPIESGEIGGHSDLAANRES